MRTGELRVSSSRIA